jgi:hypothetical protein
MVPEKGNINLQLINFTRCPPRHFREDEPRDDSRHSACARETAFPSYRISIVNHARSPFLSFIYSFIAGGWIDEWMGGRKKLTKTPS